MHSAGHDPAALLREDRRLRALARELVRDPGEADDLAQETWLAALAAGRIHALPEWMATVVRRIATNRRRGASRRERRENEAARAEALPSAADVLAREEARRRVVEALLALDEPLRTTLILRYLDDLPPRVVAARMHVPVETVRSRTRRGIELMRALLDRSFGARESWCVALVPFLRGPVTSGALSTTLIAMSIQKKLALVVVVLVGSLGWMLWHRGGGSAKPETLASSEPTVLETPPKEPSPVLAPPSEVATTRAALPSSTKEESLATEPFGSLRVQVTWFDKSPARGIAVCVRQYDSENPELQEHEGTTDESGTAVFSRVPVGHIYVVLDRGVRGRPEVEAGKETTLSLSIPRGFDVLGIVEDADGIPIAGAEVWTAYHGILVDGTLAVRTNADGSFRLRSISSESTPAFAACASGYQPSEVEGFCGEVGDEVPLRLVLHRGAGEVAGTVIDFQTSLPVMGAFVGVGPRKSMEFSVGGFTSDSGSWSRLAHTDERGQFRVTGIAPGPCSVVVRTPRYSLWREEIEVREDRSESVAAVLLPEAVLEGHVLDEQGRPVNDVSVLVGRGVEWLRAADCTSSDGSFHVGALEANVTLDARVYGRQGCVASTSFFAVPGETHEWEARLGQMGFIRGRVLDEEERPLAGWIVEISSRDGSADNATTSPDGGFRFENLQPVEQTLHASAPTTGRFSGWFPSLELVGVRPSEEELVLHVQRDRLPSSRIVGTFLDEKGRPIPGADATPWFGSGGNSTHVKCDETTGRFALGPFPPGRWRLNLSAPGRATIFLGPHEVAPGESWDCGEVRLAREGRVIARLLPLGIELDKNLRLRIRQGGWWREEGLDGDALVRSATLPPGCYEIVVLGGAFENTVVPFEIRSGEETAVEVPIRAGHLAVVRVRLADPTVSSIELHVTAEGSPVALVVTVGGSKDGTFSHSFHLAVGTYTVEAVAGERHARGELVVQPEGVDGDALELELP